MKRARVVLALSLAGLLQACLRVEHWEGTMDRCTGSNTASTPVIMLLEPASTQANGFFGYAVNGARDTWQMGEFKNGTAGGGSLKFEAVFTEGNSTARWQVDISRPPLGNEYTGTVEIVAGSTIRCDVSLTRAD